MIFTDDFIKHMETMNFEQIGLYALIRNSENEGITLEGILACSLEDKNYVVNILDSLISRGDIILEEGRYYYVR